MKQQSITVAKGQDLVRVDVFLAKHLPNALSRSFVKRLIDSGKVRVNGQIVKAQFKVAEGDKLDVVIEASDYPDESILPEDVSLDVFFEDQELAIIQKQCGMTVHPTSANKKGTLVNALLFRYKQLSDVNGLQRPGIVHRLDKETSGLMVIAKNNKTHENLARQFERHKVRKKYIALVDGKVDFDEGVVAESIGKHPRHHDQRLIVASDEGKKAETVYRVIKRGVKSSLVALYPKTGRTHQLRLHMQHLGHPILGDDKYGRKMSFPRLALHAQSLGFHHPSNGRFVQFATRFPQDFKVA